MANDFLTTYTPLANDIATQTGLDPSVVLGIIDTETGGGVHVKGNNIFGISPSGPQGQYVASYPDVQTASQAFVDLMKTPRYSRVATTGDPAGQAALLVRSGYNTANPNYAGIVASKAKAIGSQLGYQDGDSGPQQPVALMATSAQPAAAPTPAAAPPPVSSYSFPAAPGSAPAPAAAPAPAPTGSAKDQALSDPALAGGDTAAAPTQTPAVKPAAAPTSAKDQALSDPALQPTEPAKKEPPATPATMFAGNPEEAFQADYAKVFPQPAHRPASPPASLPTRQEAINALSPAPDTTYGTVLPFAKDDKTGELRLALPHMIRDPLLGLLQTPSEATTWNPQTGTYGLSPEASAVVPFAAGGLKFGGREPVPNALAAREAPLSSEFKGNALSPEAITKAREAATPAGPASPTGVAVTPPPKPEGTAQPAGAQVTPGSAAAISPQEAAAYRSVAEIQRLREPQPAGVPDRRQLVEGEDPSVIQIEQDAGKARELKALRNINPKVVEMEKAAVEQQNLARGRHLDNVSGSDVDLLKAESDRTANGEVNAATAWRNKTDADGQPVVDWADQVLKGPDGKRDAVVKQIEAVRNKIYDRNGKMETDPEQLYGVRKDINDRLSKEAARDDPMSQRAAGLLRQMRDVLDNQIEASAPGFKNYLQQWHADSQAIDAMSVMQKWAPKLWNNGVMSYSKYMQMMREAVISRRKDMPLNDWQSVTDAQMDKLWDLRDSLRRAASADELAKAKGSDTAPNAMDIARHFFKLGGMATAHGVANVVSPGWGSVALRFGQQALDPLLSAVAGRRQERRAGELLSPPPNALNNPNAPP
jgi:hypothetical protein